MVRIWFHGIFVSKIAFNLLIYVSLLSTQYLLYSSLEWFTNKTHDFLCKIGQIFVKMTFFTWNYPSIRIIRTIRIFDCKVFYIRLSTIPIRIGNPNFYNVVEVLFFAKSSISHAAIFGHCNFFNNLIIFSITNSCFPYFRSTSPVCDVIWMFWYVFKSTTTS